MRSERSNRQTSLVISTPVDLSAFSIGLHDAYTQSSEIARRPAYDFHIGVFHLHQLTRFFHNWIFYSPVRRTVSHFLQVRLDRRANKLTNMTKERRHVTSQAWLITVRKKTKTVVGHSLMFLGPSPYKTAAPQHKGTLTFCWSCCQSWQF